MADPRDYKLDITSQPVGDKSNSMTGRPFIRVQFACCNTYLRIYRSTDEKSYQGRCPRCGKPVKFVVGPGGTDTRDFIVH